MKDINFLAFSLQAGTIILLALTNIGKDKIIRRQRRRIAELELKKNHEGNN